MSQNNYTNFQFRHYAVSTVAIYGTNSPTLVSGNLVLRRYYKDASCKDMDIPRTNRSTLDTIFFETNKLIRIPLEDQYTGKRVLTSTPIPAFGSQYVIAYNTAEIPSERYDDQLAILAPLDQEAHGVAIILKKDKDGLIQWLDHKEAKEIIHKLKG